MGTAAERVQQMFGLCEFRRAEAVRTEGRYTSGGKVSMQMRFKVHNGAFLCISDEEWGSKQREESPLHDEAEAQGEESPNATQATMIRRMHREGSYQVMPDGKLQITLT